MNLVTDTRGFGFREQFIPFSQIVLERIPEDGIKFSQLVNIVIEEGRRDGKERKPWEIEHAVMNLNRLWGKVAYHGQLCGSTMIYTNEGNY